MAKAKKEPKTPTKIGSPPSPHPVNEPQADPELRGLAISHRNTYAKLKKRLGDVQTDMRAFTKEVKDDGFTLRQIKLMVELSTPEGEAAFRMMVASDLIAAQYQGASIGAQLALFLEPDRTPGTDIALDEGIQDCIEGKVARPKYDPSTPQYKSYLRGFADEQERRLKAGITKLEAVKGYIPMTAEELQNQQAEAKRVG